MPTFSDRLQQLKSDRNLLQKNIASAVNISLRTYQRYESGERKPDSEVITKLADYFNVSTDYLLGLSDESERR